MLRSVPQAWPALPAIRLLGGDNQCYLNSYLYCLIYLLSHQQRYSLLPQAFWQRTGTAQSAARLLGFGLLGWSAPRREHDVAELVEFLHPKIAKTAITGHWELRYQTDHGVNRQVVAAGTSCLRLVIRDVTSASIVDLQSLIDQWHADAELGLNAYTTAPPWLCLQLPRFYYRSPGWAVKQSHPYLFSEHLRIPIFDTADNLVVRWLTYTVLACIQHHGPRPSEGHYTAVLRKGAQQWLFDDEKKPPRLLTSRQLDHLSSNMYLIVVVQSCPAQASEASDLAASSLHRTTSTGL